jgi:hypothetical protein
VDLLNRRVSSVPGTCEPVLPESASGGVGFKLLLAAARRFE